GWSFNRRRSGNWNFGGWRRGLRWRSGPRRLGRYGGRRGNLSLRRDNNRARGLHLSPDHLAVPEVGSPGVGLRPGLPNLVEDVLARRLVVVDCPDHRELLGMLGRVALLAVSV